MFDGPLDPKDNDRASAAILRQNYFSRLTDGVGVPTGMEIQGVDVIDPALSRVNHQVGLTPEIDRIFARGEQPCVVIFKPVTEKGAGVKGSFDVHKDPNLYAVVNEQGARRLVGNEEKHDGLRNGLNRRVADLACRPA